jgi:hypothetical protein
MRQDTLHSARDTRDSSYRALRPRLGAKQSEYLGALTRTTLTGLRTQSGATIHDLTDMEAARLLGWERTSVNGRRKELTDMGLIAKAQTRRCHVTGNDVAAWRAA